MANRTAWGLLDPHRSLFLRVARFILRRREHNERIDLLKSVEHFYVSPRSKQERIEKDKTGDAAEAKARSTYLENLQTASEIRSAITGLGTGEKHSSGELSKASHPNKCKRSRGFTDISSTQVWWKIYERICGGPLRGTGFGRGSDKGRNGSLRPQGDDARGSSRGCSTFGIFRGT